MYLEAADLDDFRARRDRLFATHPQSAIPAAERSSFTGLPYFPANPDMVADVPLRAAGGSIDIDTGGPDGVVHYKRVGVLETPWGELSLWWIAAYGGGLFLPVRDATCGPESYGGGRYLTHTLKGTVRGGVQFLGGKPGRPDPHHPFNPSRADHHEWLCPPA